MKTDLYRSWRLYLNTFVSVAAVGLAVWAMPSGTLPTTMKWFGFAGLTILICVKEYDTLKGVAFINKREAIRDILSDVDALNPQLSNRQRLRSSVFVTSKRDGEKAYVMDESYNMENADDKWLAIPMNMGVTGTACRDKVQVIGDESEIYGDGKYRIPGVQYMRVAKDLKWICGTPIVSANGRRVRAVLDIDGNVALSDEDKKKVSLFAKKMVEKVAKYY